MAFAAAEAPSAWRRRFRRRRAEVHMASSLLSVGGLVSGIDTNSLVAGLVAAYSTPKTLMESQLEELESEQEAFAGLSTRLSTLQDALADISDSSSFVSYTATSSSASVVSAEAADGAAAGSYTVQVTQLATRETEVSQGFASKDTAGVLGEGTFSLTYGGTTTDIAVDTSMSLEDLVTAINEQVDGVSAYLMNTGDATNPFRLVVAGQDTGADNAISFDASTLTGTQPTFTEVSTAEDASAVINGVTVYDSDNELDDIIPGMSFSISAVGSSTVQVEADTETMSTRLAAVATAYNDVRSFINTKSAFDADLEIKGPFVSDSLVAGIENKLSSIITASFSGFGGIESLSQLGFSTQQDGSLEFDSEVFNEIYASSPDDVLNMLTNDTTGFAAKMDTLISSLTEEDGTVDTRGESLEDAIETMEERISEFEENATAYEERLKKQFTSMELALAQISASTSALSALFADTNSDSDSSS
jgi:flagellar hook-associated protein 2